MEHNVKSKDVPQYHKSDDWNLIKSGPRKDEELLNSVIFEHKQILFVCWKTDTVFPVF